MITSRFTTSRLAALIILCGICILLISGANAGASNCGSIAASGEQFDVTRSGHVSCRVAKKVTRQIRSGAHGWKYHASGDYLTKGRWRCGEGAGGGYCQSRRGKSAGVGWSFHF